MFAVFTGLNQPSPSVLQQTLENVYSTKAGRPLTLADEFVEDVCNYISSNGSRPTGIPWASQGGVLRFHYPTAFAWWLKYRRATEQGRLAKDSIRAQLLELEYLKPPAVVNGYHMYGLDLKGAQNVGLDIRNSIERTAGGEW